MISLFTSFFIIMQTSAPVSSRSLRQADNGFKHLMSWGDYTYMVSSAPAGHADAVKACENAGASLVNVYTPYESFTLARRFAGSDYGDHAMNAYTAIDWSATDVPTKMAFWIGNTITQDAPQTLDGAIADIWTFNPTTILGLSSTLSPTGHACIYLESTKYQRNGEWHNDEACETKMHFVCKKEAAEETQVVKKRTVFASLTLDCVVSPMELSVTHVYRNREENVLMVFIPYPSTCSMKGVYSSTAVVAKDVVSEALSVRYYIVDDTRASAIPFEGGIMTYVGSVEEVLGNLGQKVEQVM